MRKGARQKEARSSAQALGTSTTFNHARNRTEMPPALQSRRAELFLDWRAIEKEYLSD